MVHGVKKWNERNVRYSQDTNATESIIKKVLNENHITNRGFLESCGASAFCTLMDAMGFISEADYPQLQGQSIQLDDWIMMFLNDPKRDNVFSTGTSFDNRALANYPKLIDELFPDCKANFKLWPWNEITEELIKGHGVQICLRDPGHFIAGIAFDDEKNVILFSDPWSGRPGLINHGWHEELTEAEYITNTIGYAIVYSSK